MAKASSKFTWEEDDLVFEDDEEDGKAKKYNPFHDEQGRFSSGDGGGAAITSGDALVEEPVGGGGAEQFKEGTATWVRASDKDIAREYQVEGVKHHQGQVLGKFPTEEAFVNAVKTAPVVTVDHKMDSKISYRSRTRSMDSLLDLISGYRSYPQFRNEGTLKALEDRIKSGAPTDLPIVLNDRGSMRVFSGNTRMDIGFMHNPSVKVIMLDVSR